MAFWKWIDKKCDKSLKFDSDPLWTAISRPPEAHLTCILFLWQDHLQDFFSGYNWRPFTETPTGPSTRLNNLFIKALHKCFYVLYVFLKCIALNVCCQQNCAKLPSSIHSGTGTLAFPFCSILVLIYLDNKKEYISIGWMEKVTDLSIFLPSYIRDKDICLMLGL